KELGPNEEGELLLRGPQMMKGYLNDQASNRKSFHPSFEDPERFLRTGDVVKMDERGYITITDRLKDVIKYHGFQVSPSELESLLFQDPRLADCAVCGVKNQVGEELPWAFVVLSSSSSSSARETTTAELDRTRRDLASLVNQRVAGYKKLRGVSFVEALPKSDSGKVLKKDL
ncbi:acetyl-CoA synthetase-like protein, partial [Violaceomyces palustris]